MQFQWVRILVAIGLAFSFGDYLLHLAGFDLMPAETYDEGRDTSMIGLMIIASFVLIIILLKKLTVKKGEEVLQDNVRDPLLYIRSFGNDNPTPKDLWHSFRSYGLESTEQSIAKLLNQLGPFVALGKPGEILPPLGGFRLYIKDADWQDVVLNLIRKSQLVIIGVGNTPNFWWEFEQVVKIVPPTKLVIYYRHGFKKYFFQPEEDITYKQFKERADALLPHPLPAYVGQEEILYFDDNWNPRWAEYRGDLIITVRGFFRGSSILGYRDALAPIFKANGWPAPRVPLNFIELIWYVMVIGYTVATLIYQFL